MFDAIVIDKDDAGQRVALRQVEFGPLADGDVAVDVAWSTLNYKDALAITGSSPVVRSFPMVPGIDFAGIVAESRHPDYATGDRVVLNGWGVGEKHWGGLAKRAQVRGDWLVPLPHGISMRQAMAIGTAGYTAMLCVIALEEQGLTPEAGEIVVTGAPGASAASPPPCSPPGDTPSPRSPGAPRKRGISRGWAPGRLSIGSSFRTRRGLSPRNAGRARWMSPAGPSSPTFCQ